MKILKVRVVSKVPWVRGWETGREANCDDHAFEMHPLGVTLTDNLGAKVLVPFSNISSIVYEDSVEQPVIEEEVKEVVGIKNKRRSKK